MTTPADDTVCYVQSTLDDDGKAAVLMQWGPIQALLTPDTVFTTARDLMAAAVAAETDIALIESLRKGVRVDDAVLGAMLTDVRSRRPAPKGKTALRIAAVAGANTGKPWVTIARGSQSGQLTPGEARDMAVHWIQTAVAAQIDVRMRYALGEWDRLNVVEVEELFKLIQEAGR